MKILSNPIILRALVVLFCSTSAFLLGLLFIRQLRKKISEERDFSATPTPTLETLPLHLYNTVIQQLKQQKHELHVQSQTEQNRARTRDCVINSGGLPSAITGSAAIAIHLRMPHSPKATKARRMD